MRCDFPILEYDSDQTARIEPTAVVPDGTLPEICIISFFADAIERFVSNANATVACRFDTMISSHPVYEFSYKERRLALLPAGLGGPLSVGLLEHAIAMGSRYFVVCGAAGVLNKEIAAGHLILPTAAIRDEGTSYHYLPPAREVVPSAAAVAAIGKVLEDANIPVVRGKTWTTDAYFRETRRKIELRQSEDCICVEMEAAALFSVAVFRGVDLGYILYGGDSVAGVWDPREEFDRAVVRERLIRLSCEACCLLADQTNVLRHK